MIWALEERVLPGRVGFGGADVHSLLIPKESLPYLFLLLTPTAASAKIRSPQFVESLFTWT